jgi:hypothetical protein
MTNLSMMTPGAWVNSSRANYRQVTLRRGVCINK